jgi:hypothetical protein
MAEPHPEGDGSHPNQGCRAVGHMNAVLRKQRGQDGPEESPEGSTCNMGSVHSEPPILMLSMLVRRALAS